MTLEEVRQNIDRVDAKIRDLFVERMGLADEVARIKAQTEDAIYKPEREAVILKKQSENMDTHLVKEYQALIKRIMEISRKYQYGRTLELRDCFPYTLEKELRIPEKVAMLCQEVYICRNYQREQICTAQNYEEIARMILAGEVQAGIGILEEIGRGESDELNRMLTKQGFYINRCQVAEDGCGKKKVVEFSDRLAVLPEHNRLKICFVLPNRSGALGSVLSMISDYGVNLTEIHSTPYQDEQEWKFRFYIELSLNLLKHEAQSLIYQLSCETQELKILGSYFCEGDIIIEKGQENV